ncbi:MAG TPA: S8/S53 family peptidase [Flavipsychrobacter sp.]|nr:S8/S53 family peptidase [Flavipsychrobacter sp.]
MLAHFADANPRYAFRINFIDKKGSFSIDNPSTFLSPRALERRTKQGIRIDELDLPVSPGYIKDVLSLSNGTLHTTSKWLNSCVVWLYDSSSISKLETIPFISSITYVGNERQNLHGSLAPNTSNTNGTIPPKYKTTANAAYYGDAWGQTSFVKGECLHDKGFRGKGKLIAVLDDGFHYVNVALAFDSIYSSGRVVDAVNFVQGGNDVYSSFLTHGTLVLSTMAANIPNTYVGAAPDAEYALYVTENASSETPLEMDNMVAAFERADSIGADVVSASVGYNSFDAPFPSIPPPQLDGKTTIAAIGANIASQKGILVVITAGNEGSGGLLTPGDADSALTVGNVDINRIPAGSSGHGPNFANRIKPEVCALGQPGYVITGGLTPFTAVGTSISTPQIAGWAACLWQGSIGKTNTEIKQAIIQSSHLFPNPQMPQLGYGIPDFCQANVILNLNDVKENSNAILAYPNPFNEQLTINLLARKAERLTITITDVTGKTVFVSSQMLHEGTNKLHIKIPALASGIYVCKLMMDDEVRTLRVVKE